jgi:adenylate cyclase class 2
VDSGEGLVEYESKVPVADLAPTRERLRDLGAQLVGAADETNLYLDRDGQFARRDESLRLRQDARARVTWKGPSVVERGVTSRPEIEIVVDDFATTRQLLEHLGFVVVDQLAKHRETWRLAGIEVALDSLAFGCFVELEGKPDAVRQVAEQLDLDLSQVISYSYRRLQQQARAAGR